MNSFIYSIDAYERVVRERNHCMAHFIHSRSIFRFSLSNSFYFSLDLVVISLHKYRTATYIIELKNYIYVYKNETHYWRTTVTARSRAYSTRIWTDWNDEDEKCVRSMELMSHGHTGCAFNFRTIVWNLMMWTELCRRHWFRLLLDVSAGYLNSWTAFENGPSMFKYSCQCIGRCVVDLSHLQNGLETYSPARGPGTDSCRFTAAQTNETRPLIGARASQKGPLNIYPKHMCVFAPAFDGAHSSYRIFISLLPLQSAIIVKISIK